MVAVRISCPRRMKRIRLWGLLWMSFFLELQDVAKSEEKIDLRERQTLTVPCPFNIQMYSNSQKAWQRLVEGGKPLTLAVVQGRLGQTNKVQVGKYFLEDISEDGMLLVQMTDLRQEDSGLYRCVIYEPPKEPSMLHILVRLVVTKDPASDSTSTLDSTPVSNSISASDSTPIQNLAEISTLPSITTKTRRKPPTHLVPTLTASFSSPGLGVNPTQGTDVIRFSPISIVTIVLCGILIKSLVFTVLVVVTQRSFRR